MAAGLGFKDFVTGEVLTAADVDGYLMQGVWVFASAAARDAAVTSPQEGNFAYLKDTNVTTYYTGSAWANLDTTGMTNPMTTTGDTIYSSSGSTPARLGIGSTGQVLTVASGVPSWATPASGGMTVITSGNFTTGNATTTISSIPTTYNDLVLVTRDFYASINNYMQLRVNGITTGYGYAILNHSAVNTFSWSGEGAPTSIYTTGTGILNADKNNFMQFVFQDYANTATDKTVSWNGVVRADSDAFNKLAFGVGQCQTSDAITSISIITSDGTWSGGSYILYGVK